MNDTLSIPLNGFSSGEFKFFWEIGKELFTSFDNTEILDASVTAELTAVKVGAKVLVDCMLKGSVTVPCDRCLEDLELPINEEVKLKLVPVEGGESADEEDGRELVEIMPMQTEFDMAQIIYDYVCLSLPIQRFHKDGECNPEVMKRLSSYDEGAGNSPFAALKNLL